jgi:hypothetical protein
MQEWSEKPKPNKNQNHGTIATKAEANSLPASLEEELDPIHNAKKQPSKQSSKNQVKKLNVSSPRIQH